MIFFIYFKISIFMILCVYHLKILILNKLLCGDLFMIKKIKKYIPLLKTILVHFDLPDMYTRTAETAFYLTISIFPSLIFMICSLAYIPDINTIATDEYILKIIPEGAFQIIKSLVNSAVENRSISLIIFSFILAVWTFSKSVKSVIKGQNTSYGFKEDRGFIKINAICILFAIGFFLLTLLSISLLVYGKKIGAIFFTDIGDFFVFRLLFNVIRFLIPVIYMTYIFMNLFSLGPSKKIRFSHCVPGACVTTILWILFSFIYSIYTEYFNGMNQIYGSISTIIVLMTWIYFCSMAITIGYKVNSVIYIQDVIIHEFKEKVL